MKFVALVSGGKDSCFNILHCLANGHELVCLANLYPPQNQETDTKNDEIDSYMYQTVGHDVLELYEKCIGKPMYREPILGKANNQKLEYNKTSNDETEDLFRLLSKVLEHHPDVQGVSVGAILSNYQRTRVEDVCSRLGLTSLAYLWERNQAELMSEMTASTMEARIIKVAAIGLDDTHLGMTLQEIHPLLIRLNQQFEVHICGEGGEFETSVFDAPFFRYGKIEIAEKEIVKHTNDDVWYLKLKVQFVPKEPIQAEPDWSQFISQPSLLDETFQDVYDFIDDELTEDFKAKSPTPMADFLQLAKTVITQDDDRLYVSNISSDKSSVEDQVIDIFEKLKDILKNHSLDFENIQSSKLFVKNMNNFAKINSIYVQYFTKPLPPSRICVETVLGTEAQLSVTVIKNLSEKSGLHIQGRSYWAPCNIGPYSQGVFTKSFENDQLIRISGQIPLVPKNMELNSAFSFKQDCVLALQHFHKIKKTTSYENNLLTVCYIKEAKYARVASKAFKEYQSINEDDQGTNYLIILQVTELPKGAQVEWGGIAYKENSSLGYESDSDDEKTHIKDQYMLEFRKLGDINTTVIRESGREIYGDVESLSKSGLVGEFNTAVALFNGEGEYIEDGYAVFGKH